jgi:hypothetical protein
MQSHATTHNNAWQADRPLPQVPNNVRRGDASMHYNLYEHATAQSAHAQYVNIIINVVIIIATDKASLSKAPSTRGDPQ